MPDLRMVPPPWSRQLAAFQQCDVPAAPLRLPDAPGTGPPCPSRRLRARRGDGPTNSAPIRAVGHAVDGETVRSS